MFPSHIIPRPWKYLFQKRQTAEIQDFLQVKPLYEQERNNTIEMQHETEIWKFSYESAVRKTLCATSCYSCDSLCLGTLYHFLLVKDL